MTRKGKTEETIPIETILVEEEDHPKNGSTIKIVKIIETIEIIRIEEIKAESNSDSKRKITLKLLKHF